MMRRHPLLSSGLALGLVIALYATTSKSLVTLADEAFYQHVERRRVMDRGRVLEDTGKRYFGLYRPELPWEYSRYYEVGRALTINPRIISFYQAWGEGKEHEFKADALEIATEKGLVPMITWEPWLSAFGARSVTDPTGCLNHIVAGEFDDYIRTWARAAARTRYPFFLRPLHEIGNPAYFWSTHYGNSPELAAKTFRHIVALFRAEGALNAAFVFTPHRTEDIAAWPGAEWVDWIGFDVFNYGTLVNGQRWQSFRELLAPRVNAYRAFGRPMMVAELGCSGHGGNRRDFWIDVFESLKGNAFPEVRAVVAYDHPAYKFDGGRTTIDWGFSHETDLLPAAAAAARAAGFESPVAP